MKYLLLVIFGLSFVLGFPSSARADVNDFVINNFTVEYVIDNDVPGGSLETFEDIRLTFSDQNHGILRAIPEKYQGSSTKLKVSEVLLDGRSEQFTTYKQNGNLVLKIGSPDTTITGPHRYSIKYTQEKIVNFKEGADFYWDVNGDQWGQPFEKVSATVRFKNPGLLDPSATSCFTGQLGSVESNCTSSSSQGVVVFESTKGLLAYENMTINVPLDSNKFVAPTFKDTLKENVVSFIGLGLGLIGSALIYNFWRKNGKDYKGKGVIIPEFELPRGMSPAEVGMLADYRVDSRDITSTIIDLAVRGYLKLYENTSKVLFFNSKKYSIELKRSDQNGLKKHEIAVIDMIFASQTTGTIVELKKMDKTKMGTTLTTIRKDIKSELTDKYGYIEARSYKLLAWFVGLGIAVIILQFVFSFIPWGFHVGLIIIGASLILCGAFMIRRSQVGVEVYEKIMGLKLYMNVAEKNRLKITQSTDGAEVMPEKTVELFEKLLPYAVALGVEKSWAKQFEGVLNSSPDWISSNSLAAFTGASIASSVSGFSSSFSSSFESSSGASSSGGSGGGGGGGGGGGW